LLVAPVAQTYPLKNGVEVMTPWQAALQIASQS
jgi:hypothetical protein